MGRLDGEQYPKLTEIGAWRVLPSMSGATERYGGYYSQVEVRSLVAYAAQRNITIVPEIEMPGHASAGARLPIRSSDARTYISPLPRAGMASSPISITRPTRRLPSSKTF